MASNSDKPSAKILVLGDSGVGKSSLIHLICHLSVLNSAQWTIGCSIYVKLHENCFLEFWDVGGSRSHKIARSFLYQDYHGIILVFDSTNKKSRSNLDEWLAEVTQKSNDSRELDKLFPIIYIGTKKDLLPYGIPLDYDKKKNENFSVVNFNGNDSQMETTIYVDTQDNRALSHGTDDYRELYKFFRKIIDRRTNKFSF